MAVVADSIQSNSSLAPFASGLLGLAFSPNSGVWTASSTDADHTYAPTDSFLTTLFKGSKIPHKFSLAVSRGEKNASDGGIFTLGGLPDLLDPRVNVTSDFASVDLVAAFNATDQTEPGMPKLGGYLINVDGLYYGTLGNVSINHTPTQYILDSGTPDLRIPPLDFERWLSMVDPPMPGSSKTRLVYCNATIPDLSFRIGGKLLKMNSKDLIGATGSDGLCFLLLRPSLDSECFLGDPFHRNVLAVYDWENEQMQ